MLNSGNNVNRSSATLSSTMPSLPQCLPLEPIMLSDQKYTRSGELSRVLGFPLGSITDDHSLGVGHSKPPPPVATEELKHFKESVQDASRRARDRAKMLRESIFKLDKYKEALSSKKRQRSDLSSSERSNGVNIVKLGSQIYKNPRENMTQRLEDRTKSVGFNKRVRTSVADVRADVRSAATSRQQVVTDKDEKMPQAVNAASVRIEEKTRRLLARGEGLDQKVKKKRSVGAVSHRITGGELDIQRATHPKLSGDLKLRSCDVQGVRLKTSLGVGGINKSEPSFESSNLSTCTVLKNDLENAPVPKDRSVVLEQRVVKGDIKLNIQEGNPVGSLNTVIKGKASRAPRTGSIMNLDSLPNVHSPSAPCQGWQQPAGENKGKVASVMSNQKRAMSSGSSIQPMAQWVGQRPHKNSRTRRTSLVAPSPNNAEAQISCHSSATSDFSARTSSVGTNGSQLTSSIDNHTPKSKRESKRELQNASSPFGLSGSEESGARGNKLKDKGMDSIDNALAADKKVGAHLFPYKKNKSPTKEIGDNVRRQGRSGRGSSLTRPGSPPTMVKSENLPTTKSLQGLKPMSDKNKSKTGRPPSKKIKDRKVLTCVGPSTCNGSSDFTGESDDDHEELFLAANSARNASKFACSGPFWKKMELVFGSLSSEDISYLQRQLSFAEELGESLSQMFSDEYNISEVLMRRAVPKHSGEREGSHFSQDSLKTDALCEQLDMKRLEKVTPLYQRVLSALIEEGESEELYHQSEGRNIHLWCATDGSHCGSCNQNHIDVEPKDWDRMESEVESKVDVPTQRYCMLDRLSCDGSAKTCTLGNGNMCNFFHSQEQWHGHDDLGDDDLSDSDVEQLQPRKLDTPSFPSSDCQYQLMCLDDRLLLELQSIGLCPERLPDLTEVEDVINQDIMGLEQELHQQIARKKKNLAKIDKTIQRERATERRRTELVAMDQLIEMAYRKRLASHGNYGSKNAVRKVSKQVALAFLKRTLSRCRKFEEGGISCFSDPELQKVIFSEPSCNSAAKSIDCVGSGTPSNTCNGGSHQAEVKRSAAASSVSGRYDSHSDNLERGSSVALRAVIDSSGQASFKHGSVLNLNKGKKREVLITDIGGSASPMVTSALDDTHQEVHEKKNEREKGRHSDNLRNNLSSGAGRTLLDSSGSEFKTKGNSKQKNTQLPSQSVANGSNTRSGVGPSLPGNTRTPSSKEADEPTDFANLQLPELDSLEENQDLSTWLNFDEDGLQDHDSIGLEIPMDDLSELMLM